MAQGLARRYTCPPLVGSSQIFLAALNQKRYGSRADLSGCAAERADHARRQRGADRPGQAFEARIRVAARAFLRREKFSDCRPTVRNDGAQDLGGLSQRISAWDSRTQAVMDALAQIDAMGNRQAP